MEYDDFWFNTMPEEFIFTHYPEDNRWQFNKPSISKSQYEVMPYIPQCYFKIGFNGREVLPAILDGSLTEFPKSYTSKGVIKIISLPYNGSIAPGKTIRVKIKSSNAVKMAYQNNGSIINMQKEGDEFSAEITTTYGQLTFMATFEEYESSYSIFLEYAVR